MLATFPPGTVVAELPFGFTSWELRYVYYSSVHLHRLVNGYSGGFPDDYLAAPGVAAAAACASRPGLGRACQRRRHSRRRPPGSGFDDDELAALGWLETRGARRVGSFGRDELFQLPR